MSSLQEALSAKLGIPYTPNIWEEPYSPKQVAVVVNGVKYNLEHLLTRGDIPLWDIDRVRSEQAFDHISLPRRTYHIDNWVIYYWNWNTKKRIWIDGFLSQNYEKIEDLDRELVVIIKGGKDLFDKSSFAIKHMRNRLLFLCTDPQKLEYLKTKQAEAMNLCNAIDWAYAQRLVHATLESRSREFYETTVKNLDLSELDLSVIRALSWEWKSTPEFRSNPYACRCWIIAVCFFWLIKHTSSSSRAR